MKWETCFQVTSPRSKKVAGLKLRRFPSVALPGSYRDG